MDTQPGPNLHVVWLNQGTPARSIVGGKAASLGRLTALGAPVPPAFALTTHAYAEFSAWHGFPTRVADVAPDRLASVRSAILAAPFPAALTASIQRAHAELEAHAGRSLALAVRSSATAEDSAAYSFAGLHDTVLDVRTLVDLEMAIRQCWASLWSDRAVAYRHESGLAGEISEMGVVVQQLVQTDVSFVAFTSDPVGDRADQLVITATWGLGEAVVASLVVPDYIIVAADGEISQYSIGSKHLMVIAGESAHDGTREVPVPRSMQGLPVLTSHQATLIASVTRGLAHQLGFPADFEGGFANGVLFLFQARPITTLVSSSPSVFVQHTVPSAPEPHHTH